jgi:hypothetical protein
MNGAPELADRVTQSPVAGPSSPPAAIAPKTTTTEKQNEDEDNENEFHEILQNWWGLFDSTIALICERAGRPTLRDNARLFGIAQKQRDAFNHARQQKAQWLCHRTSAWLAMSSTCRARYPWRRQLRSRLGL